MNNHWAGKFIARVICNALAGGFLAAVVGAICLGATGYGVGTFLDYVYSSLPGAKFASTDNLAALMLPSSMAAGFLGSGLVGAIIFGIAAFKAPPGRFFKPLSALGGRVALGQIAGTVGALTFCAALELVKMRLGNQSFSDVVTDDLNLIMIGVPVLMICGAIAGALSKRETARSATLKAE